MFSQTTEGPESLTNLSNSFLGGLSNFEMFGSFVVELLTQLYSIKATPEPFHLDLHSRPLVLWQGGQQLLQLLLHGTPGGQGGLLPLL